jgi:hypothetical protein
VLARQLGRAVEVDEPHLAGDRVQEDVARLDVFVDDAPPVYDAERSGHRHGDGEEHVEGNSARSGRGGALSAEVLDDHRVLVTLPDEIKGARRALGVELAQDAVLELELGDLVGRGVVPGERLEDDRSAVVQAPSPAHDGASRAGERLFDLVAFHVHVDQAGRNACRSSSSVIGHRVWAATLHLLTTWASRPVAGRWAPWIDPGWSESP